MTNDHDRRSPALVRSAILGFVGGLRSMMPLALVAAHLQRHPPLEPITAGWALDWLGSRLAVQLLGVAALGEVIADKLPVVPDRLEPVPLAGRVILGGTACALASQADGGSPDTAALVGALSAIGGSLVGYSLRSWLTRVLPARAVDVALAEDILAFLLGSWALKH